LLLLLLFTDGVLWCGGRGRAPRLVGH